MDKFRIFKRVIIAIIIALAILAVGNSSHAAVYDADDYWKTFTNNDSITSYDFKYNWYTYRGNEYIMKANTLNELRGLLGSPTGAWYDKPGDDINDGDPNINEELYGTGLSDFAIVLPIYSNVHCIDPQTDYQLERHKTKWDCRYK